MAILKDKHLAVSEEVHKEIHQFLLNNNNFKSADDYLRHKLGLERPDA